MFINLDSSVISFQCVVALVDISDKANSTLNLSPMILLLIPIADDREGDIVEFELGKIVIRFVNSDGRVLGPKYISSHPSCNNFYVLDRGHLRLVHVHLF